MCTVTAQNFFGGPLFLLCWVSSCRLCEGARGRREARLSVHVNVCTHTIVSACVWKGPWEASQKALLWTSAGLLTPCDRLPLTTCTLGCKQWLQQSHDMCIFCVFLESYLSSNYPPFTWQSASHWRDCSITTYLLASLPFPLYAFPTASEHCWRGVS